MLEKSIHFQALDLTRFLMCSVISTWAPFVERHTSRRNCFSSGTDKHYCIKALCSYDGSVMYTLHFFVINNVCYKPTV